MMAIVVIVKNIAMSGSVIARLSIMASGRLSAETAIMNDNAVPKGIPFSKRTTAIGTIAAQLPYIGTPINVATGTEKMPVLLNTPWIIVSGT